MDAHEFAEKYRNNKKKTTDSYEQIVKWCSENAENLDLSDKDQKYLYGLATVYLMKVKIGRWNDDDSKVMISCLAKMYASELDIDQEVAVKVLTDDEYKKVRSDSSNAVCIDHGDDTFTIAYSPKVVEQLKSNNPEELLRGLQTVFHEVVHAQQNSVLRRQEINGEDIQYSGNTYRMALETVVRKVKPQFYNDNYDNLFKENQAEHNGLIRTMATLKAYNPKVYEMFDQEALQQRLKRYAEKMVDDREMQFGKVSYRVDGLMDMICTRYIELFPEILESYPVLQRAYNADGSKKNITQLLQDRQALIDSGEFNEKTDDLYATIANYRNYDKGVIKAELAELDEYIQKTGTDDEFIFQLIEHRLGRMNVTEQGISQYMYAVRKQAEKFREISKLEAEKRELDEEAARE